MRKIRLIPLQDIREASLFFVISVLCFLSSLSIIVGKASYEMTAKWASDIENTFTLSVDVTAKDALEIAKMLRQQPSLDDARLVSDPEIDAILIERFGTAKLPEGLGLPILIEVQAKQAADFGRSELSDIIAPLTKNYEIYQHTNWIDQFDRYLDIVKILAAIISVLLIGSTALIVGFATHSALYSRRDVISVLHRSGAQDRFIAKLFQRRFWSLGLRSGFCGAIGALGVAAFVSWLFASEAAFSNILPRYVLNQWDLLIIAILPVGVGYICQFTAKYSVFGALKRLY